MKVKRERKGRGKEKKESKKKIFDIFGKAGAYPSGTALR
jgi:hypothetical protein